MMNKSKMSAEQLENRAALARILESNSWKLRNEEAFNADFLLDAELSARKRNKNCIMEVNVSYENNYVGIAVASFKSGRAEYITYFNNLEESAGILEKIISNDEDMSVVKSLELANDLISAFKNKVYFFNGDELELVSKENLRTVFDKNQ